MRIGKLDAPAEKIEIRTFFSPFSDRLASIRMSSHKPRYIASVLGVLAATILLASCAPTKLFKPSPVNYRDEAGGVLLSVNSVGRWEQVADAMQPKFNLASGDAALSKVLPTTAHLQQQILNAFGFSLGLGLPQSFRESVATRTASESQTSTGTTSSQGYTSTTTATMKPGVAPTPPSGTPAGGELPSATAPGSDLGLDPLLQYRAAASLYQAVQLMNREVDLAAKRKGYVPYMVRMQLATIPYRPHLPYDVHAQVEFFPANRTLSIRKADKDTRLPYVVPLIVTDDLEKAIASRAAEVARQIGLAVNFMVQGVGGNIGANAQSRNRESVLAADVNSLLTVARLNDNGIYIRLGAANEATGGHSLVGRTYDIALLLLVPDSYFVTQIAPCKEQTGSPEVPFKKMLAILESLMSEMSTPPADASKERVTLSVITHTDFRDASSGILLKERRDETLVGQIENAFERTLKIGYPEMFAAWSRKTQEDKLSIARKLIAPIQTSEYAKFYGAANSITLPAATKSVPSGQLSGKCTIHDGESDPQPEDNGYRLACISEGYLRALWGYLASTLVEGSTKSASVELPALPDIVIPKQTALMRDDGKERLDIVLRDVSGITSPGGIWAKLVLKNNDGKSYEFPAETISPDPANGTLALQFPSLAKWDLGKIVFNQSHLCIEPRPCPFRQACATDKIEDHSFNVLLTEASADKPKPGFDFRASMKEIVVDKGAGTVKLVFDNFKDDNAILTWSGTEVKSAKDSDGVAVPIALDKITVKAATVLTLEILNAKPDGKVTFAAVGSKNDKKTAEVTKEFTFVSAEAPADKSKPGFDFRASTNTIKVDKGVGTVELEFGNFKDDSAVITWTGAEVKSAKDSDGVTVPIALDKITVKRATVLTMEIQNAKPEGKVIFTAVGSKNDKKTGEVTKEFTFVPPEAPADKSKPGFDLRVSIKEILVDKGAGTVKLVFDNFKDDNAILTWSGAEVKSAKDSDGVAVPIALDKITVKRATVLTLEIQNAKPDGKVTFTAVGSKNGKKTGEVTKEFNFVASK
jgi:hypothetical protein